MPRLVSLYGMPRFLIDADRRFAEEDLIDVVFPSSTLVVLPRLMPLPLLEICRENFCQSFPPRRTVLLPFFGGLSGFEEDFILKTGRSLFCGARMFFIHYSMQMLDAAAASFFPLPPSLPLIGWAPPVDRTIPS